ncbi:hypothetical protein BJX63DRAFT_433762 [Aspergillus granulosus]|uniref:Uncharacterized protein n=1 Tax=Aspergillus granulosus TaxID=176169 RepID=A0ABR4H656_9EURO
MTSYEIWLLETKPQPEIGSKWTLALRQVGTNRTTLYTLMGGVRIGDGPYTHKAWPNVPFSPVFLQPCSPFEKYTPIGTIDELGKLEFEEFFHRTEVGPNQFFVVRFFAQLAKTGLLGWDVVREWKGKARYTEKEWEIFLGKYTIVDQAFLDNYEEIQKA